MGEKLANFILSFRIPILIVLALITSFFGYFASTVELDYEEFKELFGNDGFNILVGTKDKDFYTIDKFNKWKELGEEFSKIEGIDSSFSEANFYTIVKLDSSKPFNILPISPNPVTSVSQLDSIKKKIRTLPFYKGMIFMLCY
ncbi:MAG: putative RND superfamily exporter protein [Flavobacteriales bacterium]